MKKLVLVLLSLMFLSGCETGPQQRLAYVNGQPWLVVGDCNETTTMIATDSVALCKNKHDINMIKTWAMQKLLRLKRQKIGAQSRF